MDGRVCQTLTQDHHPAIEKHADIIRSKNITIVMQSDALPHQRLDTGPGSKDHRKVGLRGADMQGKHIGGQPRKVHILEHILPLVEQGMKESARRTLIAGRDEGIQRTRRKPRMPVSHPEGCVQLSDNVAIGHPPGYPQTNRQGLHPETDERTIPGAASVMHGQTDQDLFLSGEPMQEDGIGR